MLIDGKQRTIEQKANKNNGKFENLTWIPYSIEFVNV